MENHGPMAGTTYGVTLSAKANNPLRGTSVLLNGEDPRQTEYRWASPDALEIRLPCGWWSHLRRRWQLLGTDRVIAITYLPPQGCDQHKGIAPSSSVPN